MNLPALPEHADLITPDVAVELERQVAGTIAQLDDFDLAEELIATAVAAIEEGSARFKRAPNAVFQYVGFEDLDAAWFTPGVGWVNAATGERL